MRRWIGWTLVAVVLSIGAALFATWPLGRFFDRTIVTPVPRCTGASCAETNLSLWVVTEGGRRFYESPTTVYEAGIFHPLRHALTYSESGLTLGALAFPVSVVAGNPLIGFNVVYLATYALTGLGVFLVVQRLTGVPVAGLLAALMAVLEPTRWAARGHIFELATLGLPFVLHATLVCLDRPTWLRAGWLALAVILAGQLSVYYAALLPLVLLPWLGILLWVRRRSPRPWVVTAAALTAGEVLSAATYLAHYLARQELTPETVKTLPLALLLGAVAPLRLHLVAGVCAAIVTGIAVAVVVTLWRGRFPRALVAVLLTAVVLLESQVRREPMPLTPITELTEPAAVYRWLATTPPDTAVLELPFGDAGTEAAAFMLPALYHRRSLVNGYSALRPIVPLLFAFPSDLAITTLADAGVSAVLVHDNKRLDPRLVRRLQKTTLPRERVGGTLVFHVPAEATSQDPEMLAPRIPREAWHLSSSQIAAADGDLTTHWRVEEPRREDAVFIELEGAWSVYGITLALGPHVLEYPRGYVVRGSLKEGKWREIGREPNAVPPLRSYRRNHRHVEMPLRIRASAVQRLEIRAVVGSGPFGIHEIELYGRPIGPPV